MNSEARVERLTRLALGGDGAAVRQLAVESRRRNDALGHLLRAVDAPSARGWREVVAQLEARATPGVRLEVPLLETALARWPDQLRVLEPMWWRGLRRSMMHAAVSRPGGGAETFEDWRMWLAEEAPVPARFALIRHLDASMVGEGLEVEGGLDQRGEALANAWRAHLLDALSAQLGVLRLEPGFSSRTWQRAMCAVGRFEQLHTLSIFFHEWSGEHFFSSVALPSLRSLRVCCRSEHRRRVWSALASSDWLSGLEDLEVLGSGGEAAATPTRLLHAVGRVAGLERLAWHISGRGDGLSSGLGAGDFGALRELAIDDRGVMSYDVDRLSRVAPFFSRLEGLRLGRNDRLASLEMDWPEGLRSLDLFDAMLDGDPFEWLAHIDRLEALELGLSAPERSLRFRNRRTLEALLRQIGRRVAALRQALGRRLPVEGLKALGLRRALLGDGVEATLTRNEWSSLEALDLGFNRLVAGDLRALRPCHALRTLRLDGNPLDSDALRALHESGRLPGLETLGLSGCGLDHGRLHGLLDASESLTSLDISDNGLGMSDLMDLLEHPKVASLRSLGLDFPTCELFTLADVMPARMRDTLEVLTLSFPHGLPSLHGLRDVVAHARSLTRIEVRHPTSPDADDAASAQIGHSWLRSEVYEQLHGGASSRPSWWVDVALLEPL